MKKPVNISEELYNVILERIGKSKDIFSSVDEYIEYAMNEILEINQDNGKENVRSEEQLSKEEKERVENELKKLGYI